MAGTGELFAGTPDGLTQEEIELERSITHAALRFHTEKNPDRRAYWWAELKRMHGLRTANTVARMERKRGLVP